MISVCVAYRNDRFIYNTVNALLKGVDSTRFEIIIYDDCSDEPIEPIMSQYPNVRVIRGNVQRGVGYAFDVCVREAKGDVIVLMGSDVLVKDPSWINTVSEFVSMYPDSIGCSTCLSLDPDHLDPRQPANDTKRYGAKLLPFVTTDELPSDSPLLHDTSQYVIDMFNGRWHRKVPTENVNKVACLMGAFYFTSKSWYMHIGGWDFNHRYWGSLEGWISLKSWLMGGSIHNVRDFETGHIFSKFGSEKSPHGRTDWYWYNKMFVAHTMLPEDLAKRLISKICSLRVNYQLHTHPFNLGKKLIKDNWSKVEKARDRNQMLFKHDFYWYCNKFGIEINF